MYESSFEKKFIKAAEVLYAAEGDRLMQETDVSLKCTGTEVLFKKRSRHHVQDFFISTKSTSGPSVYRTFLTIVSL